MAMPNLHYIPMNLSHFKLDNPASCSFRPTSRMVRSSALSGAISRTHQRATGALPHR